MKLSADLDTLDKVRNVLALARKRGRDAAEALDEAQLLSYPARDAGVRALALLAVAEVLSESQVAQIAAAVGMRMPMSTLDAKQMIVAWLRMASEPVKEER